MVLADLLLDLRDDPLRLLRPAVREQPARALGDEAPDGDDAECEDRADPESQPPADRLANVVEQLVREEGGPGGSDPPRAVDDDVDAAADPGRDQFVDR